MLLAAGTVAAACSGAAGDDASSVPPSTAAPGGATAVSAGSILGGGGAPTDVSAVPADGSVTPVWRAPDGDDGTDFRVQYRTSDGPGEWTDAAGDGPTFDATEVAGLDNGTSYDFRVAARDGTSPGPWSSVVSATPGPVTSMAFDFDISDGPFPGLPTSDPATYPVLQVVDRRLQTLDDTRLYGGGIAHGVDVSGDWQLDFDVHAPLGIGDGGATVALVDDTFTGWSIFAGNATHIQDYADGEHVNLTNDSRGAETQHITLTRRASDGLMRVYADGVLQGSTTERSRAAGGYLAVFLQATDSPRFETWIDDLVLRDSRDDD